MPTNPPDDAAADARAATEAVERWVVDVERLLAQTQTALESLREHSGVPRDAQNAIYQLLVLVRHRRAQTPTRQAIRSWMRSLVSSGQQQRGGEWGPGTA
jgi:hypothetical protein